MDVELLPSEGALAPLGYAHPIYAQSLAAFGEPRFLEHSGSWVLLRSIPGTRARDARGSYPLFHCRNWGRLSEDLGSLATHSVSLCVVTDPMRAVEPEELRACFPDLCRPFKEHFVIDFARGDPARCPHHRRNVRRALAEVSVEVCPHPLQFEREWIQLYGDLVLRHQIRGIAAFSPAALAAQLRVPGLVMLRAVRREHTVGMTLWYDAGDVVYYHLGAATTNGYRAGAFFALFAAAIDHFRSAARWIHLGGGAGLTSAPTDGLARFKRGWATGTRTAWLCGRIFDRPLYERLTAMCAPSSTDYFPAYRSEALR